MSRAAAIAFALLLALGPALPTAWAKDAGGGQALRPRLEGQALVDALKQGGQLIPDLFSTKLSHKAQPAQINPGNRYLPRNHYLSRPQDSAVATDGKN